MPVNTTETLSAILAEMKRENRPYGISLERPHYCADRLEAAAKREAEEKSAPGNAAALREALEQAKRDHWYDMSPDLRNKIFAALSAPPEPPSNAAAMRAVVERCRDYFADLLTLINPEDENRLLKECDAALAAPARNCDRFADPGKAWLAYKAECDEDETVPNMIGAISWLFSPAEGGDHA